MQLGESNVTAQSFTPVMWLRSLLKANGDKPRLNTATKSKAISQQMITSLSETQCSQYQHGFDFNQRGHTNEK